MKTHKGALPTKYPLILLPLFIALNGCSQTEIIQTEAKDIDTLEFQVGYPNLHTTAIEQLKTFPSPRYLPRNKFIRLFNWMNPCFMGGEGQAGITEAVAINNAEAIQEELIMHWNYFLIIPNTTTASKSEWLDVPNSRISSYIELANKYPQIPLGITSFWTQLKPKHMGMNDYYPSILKPDLPNKYYIKNDSGRVIKRSLNFAAPDSLFISDGKLQKACIENIVKHLTRPINIINENGEEPPSITSEKISKEDKDMIIDNFNHGRQNWHIYISGKKTHFRQLYSSQFMNTIPELKGTAFTIYALEGGPIDRFDWHSSKAASSKIKGNYYSTADFYPRKPKNWMVRDGAWHGWQWMNDGRKVEIADGDKFCSPFIAAGWATNPEEDVRCAQWLGLLKCLNVVGAEFFYVGYFNLKKPFTKPENYVWQAAMPAYAQAVATHYADVFAGGNVLFDDAGKPVVTYPCKEKDVLITVRKSSAKAKYVIAATVQPASNTERFPLEKNVEIKLDGETLLIKARRQGSVYVYDKSVSPHLFYQLDRWHEYEHPMRWRKDIVVEAEVFDTANAEADRIIKSEYVNEGSLIDVTNAVASVSLNARQWVEYGIDRRDLEHFKKPVKMSLLIRSKTEGRLNVIVNGKENLFTIKRNNDWQWVGLPFEPGGWKGNFVSVKLESLSDGVEIDKLIITDGSGVGSLKGY